MLWSTIKPFQGAALETEVQFIRREYRRIYNRLREERNLSFELMSRNQFQHFKIHNVPALRSSMDQVLRWLVPTGHFVLGAALKYSAEDFRGV